MNQFILKIVSGW